MGVVRILVALLLALGLLGAVAPAMEDARDRRTATVLAASGERLGTELSTFAAQNDAVGVGAARTSIQVRVPSGGALWIGSGPDHPSGDGPRSDVLVGVPPGPSQRTVSRLPVDLRVDRAGATDTTPIVLREDATLRVRYGRHNGHPCLFVARGSLGDDRTTRFHDMAVDRRTAL